MVDYMKDTGGTVKDIKKRDSLFILLFYLF